MCVTCHLLTFCLLIPHRTRQLVCDMEVVMTMLWLYMWVKRQNDRGLSNTLRVGQGSASSGDVYMCGVGC